jgi:glucan phosphoethanolaminetransferase (alkaline phosphatase superfamily)
LGGWTFKLSRSLSREFKLLGWEAHILSFSTLLFLPDIKYHKVLVRGLYDYSNNAILCLYSFYFIIAFNCNLTITSFAFLGKEPEQSLDFINFSLSGRPLSVKQPSRRIDSVHRGVYFIYFAIGRIIYCIQQQY